MVKCNLPRELSVRVTWVTLAKSNTLLLDKISIPLVKGRIHCLLGQSGVGKSSLLKAISQVDALYQAQFHLDLEHTQSSFDSSRVSFGLVPQTPMLLPWLTVKGNLRLGLLESGATDVLLRDALSSMRLVDCLHKFPSEISLGMQARISFLRTFLMNPDILLMDEPFSALDGVNRFHIQIWLKSIFSSLQLFGILVTHDLDEVINLGADVSVLSGSPASVSFQMLADELAALDDPKKTLLNSLGFDGSIGQTF